MDAFDGRHLGRLLSSIGFVGHSDVGLEVHLDVSLDVDSAAYSAAYSTVDLDVGSGVRLDSAFLGLDSTF